MSVPQQTTARRVKHDIKKLRTSLGMTQEQIAHALGVSWITVSRWERGVSRPSALAFQQLERLAKGGKSG